MWNFEYNFVSVSKNDRQMPCMAQYKRFAKINHEPEAVASLQNSPKKKNDFLLLRTLSRQPGPFSGEGMYIRYPSFAGHMFTIGRYQRFECQMVAQRCVYRAPKQSDVILDATSRNRTFVSITKIAPKTPIHIAQGISGCTPAMVPR